MSKNTSENGDVGREESKEADTAELTVSSLKFQTLMELERQFWFKTVPSLQLDSQR